MFTFVIEVKLPPCIKLPLYCAGSTYMISCPAHMCFFFGRNVRIELSINQNSRKSLLHPHLVHAGSIVFCQFVWVFSSYPLDIEILDLSGRHWNTGLVSCELSLISWREGISLALVGHRPSDDVTIKIPYGVDVLLQWSPSHPIFF